MTSVKFAVIGNPVVDGLARVAESFPDKFRLNRGDSNVVEHDVMFHLGEGLEIEKFESGGAAANVAYTLCKMGFPVCFMGPLGNDPAGRHFFKEMVATGLTLNNAMATYRTTELFVLISPDGTRTMVQPQPKPPSDDEAWVDENLLASADWVVIGGYVTRDWPNATQTVMRIAHGNDSQVALQLPAPRACAEAAPALLALLEMGVDLILGNHEEYLALNDFMNDAQRAMLAATPRVVTYGGEGASFYDGQGNEVKESTRRITNPADNTGAGDAFAAGFLAVYAEGGEPAVALRRAHHLGGAVIQQVGPRLADPMAVWMNNAPGE